MHLSFSTSCSVVISSIAVFSKSLSFVQTGILCSKAMVTEGTSSGSPIIPFAFLKTFLKVLNILC